MQPKRVSTTNFSCPACGFRVFNRRYPKCERCKTALPASLLLSELERQALLKGEEEQLSSKLERTRDRRAPASLGSLGAASGGTTTEGWSSANTSSDTFTSGGGGIFDGGGASGSFGGDSGSSFGGDGS